jgi:hypothetical protein
MLPPSEAKRQDRDDAERAQHGAELRRCRAGGPHQPGQHQHEPRVEPDRHESAEHHRAGSSVELEQGFSAYWISAKARKVGISRVV